MVLAGRSGVADAAILATSHADEPSERWFDLLAGVGFVNVGYEQLFRPKKGLGAAQDAAMRPDSLAWHSCATMPLSRLEQSLAKATRAKCSDYETNFSFSKLRTAS